MDKNILKTAERIGKLLIRRDLRLSIAESCTGGAVAQAITRIRGASRFFELSVVSYSEKTKKSVLGVSSSILKKHGTVSEETAMAMARGVKKLGKTEVSLAVTGIAGPDAIEGKKVGLVCLAVMSRGIARTKEMTFRGTRDAVISQAVKEALRFLEEALHPWE